MFLRCSVQGGTWGVTGWWRVVAMVWLMTVVNNTTLNGLRVDFASRTYNQRAWWQFWGSGDQYIEVPNSSQTSLSNLVYTTLNN